jgi:hypothetical protein
MYYACKKMSTNKPNQTNLKRPFTSSLKKENSHGFQEHWYQRLSAWNILKLG